MKTNITAAIAGLALLSGAGLAAAQDVVVQPQEQIIIQPQQETVIREYVKKKPLASIAIPGVELNIGSTVPETVELHAIEAPDMQYEYVVVDNRTVIVDPGTRRIIRVLD
ncbi:DUF1236 domain-containing protein [Mesorhizobium sp. BE184]|uniref:DUF1236 domain-containing protein n=1 Tax=Mesorhizobium sp. BE184 TaxID=2817714 RepID=UPI0028592C4F|nr:DUF1236 domain-containing protein [Mesorhizobium sp. BE184]MDR7031487.1 hypothetical protein [Mesorhizobium sp. BE184]